MVLRGCREVTPSVGLGCEIKQTNDIAGIHLAMCSQSQLNHSPLQPPFVIAEGHQQLQSRVE
jgi:hypothetical protein